MLLNEATVCFSKSTINLPQISLKFDMTKLSNLYFIFPFLIKLYELEKLRFETLCFKLRN